MLDPRTATVVSSGAHDGRDSGAVTTFIERKLEGLWRVAITRSFIPLASLVTI
jgi:hypothetical protein